MAFPGTITNLRYLDRSRLRDESQIMKNYYREIINYKGLDAVYYRHNASFFEEPSSRFVDYTYGEYPTMGYWLSGDVVAYMEIRKDDIFMSKFGMETNGDGIVYIVKDDFTEQFRDSIGTPETDTFTATITGVVENFYGTLSGDVVNDELSGFTSGMVSFLTSGDVSGTFTEGFTRYPEKYVDLMYKSREYTDRVVWGDLSGIYSGTLDISGNGTITGTVSGELQYYTEEPEKNGQTRWKIAPQVGDFFRLDYDEENQQEYEITRVYDSKLHSDGGVSQLLYRYIWVCDVVRRDPSYETVLGEDVGNNTEEPDTPVLKDTLSDFAEVISDEIFDYDNEVVDNIDLYNSDNVYGNY